MQIIHASTPKKTDTFYHIQDRKTTLFSDSDKLDLDLTDDSLKQSQDEFDLDLSDFTEEEVETSQNVPINDALVLSLRNKARVDINYISEISGKEKKEIVQTLKGVIFQNPLKCNGYRYEGFEESSEYLSGNLYQKLLDAKEGMKKYKFDFSENIKALTGLLEASTINTSTSDIYVTLGTPWIPAIYVRDYIRHLLDASRYTQSFEVIHDEYTGIWEFQNYYVFNFCFNNDMKYGTPRINALNIIKKTLNNQNIAIYDSEPYYDKHSSKTKRILNKEETVAALNKQQAIIADFQNWIWSDPKRSEKLKEIYTNKYASIRKRTYNGSFLEFKGLNKDLTLFDYQKNAIARILFNPNTLLAHECGAGKTFIMACAGMELKRLGLSKKNMYVVPNNIVSEWRDNFLYAYPDSHLLVIDPKSFKKEKRTQVLKDIKSNDYDAIIIAYSCFGEIEMSIFTEETKLAQKIDELNELSKKNSSKALESEINSLEKKLDKLKEKEKDLLSSKNAVNGIIPEDNRDIYFDELGITRLFIDECHNFKNVPIKSQITYVLGISKEGSDKCEKMLEKVRYTQVNNHGGVIMATGTPITNSITDAYVFQKYLEEGELKMLDISNFDEWVQMFSEKQSEFEVDVDTNSYRLATRFNRFHNIPELTSVLSLISDFYTVHKEDLPQCNGYTDIISPKNKEFDAFLKVISERADACRHHKVSRKEDNLLKITTDGRKAALDLRLIDSKKYQFNEESKVSKCALEVSKLYFKTMDKLSTQLVFCDSSTPKDSFNMYDELKRLLIRNGVKEEEIAFVHDATTEKAKTKMFESMRNGTLRILIGSTQKLGTGVNVQDRLIAIHHLDVPWKPSDMKQREGRLIRQGNNNEEVYIYRYITAGSFDAYSWQLLETKQKMIEQLLSGTMYDATISDVSDTVLSYAEIKALAIGNPLLKNRFEVANDLSRMILLNKKEVEKRAKLQSEENYDKQMIKDLKAINKNLEKDISEYNQNRIDYTIKSNQDQRNYFRDRFIERYNEYLRSTSPFYDLDKDVFRYQGLYITFPGKKVEEETDLSYLGIKTKKMEKHILEDDPLLADNNLEDAEDTDEEDSVEDSNKFVYVHLYGTYKVQLGKSEKGYLIRIDNCLEGLSKRLEKSKEQIKTLNKRIKAIDGEYDQIKDYSSEIETLKNKLAKIDKGLGVKE